MVTVDEYGRVRRAHRDGVGIRALAKRFRHSRRKVREILATPEPKPYLRLNPPPSILDPFKPIIDGILQSDEGVAAEAASHDEQDLASAEGGARLPRRL